MHLHNKTGRLHLNFYQRSTKALREGEDNWNNHQSIKEHMELQSRMMTKCFRRALEYMAFHEEGFMEKKIGEALDANSKIAYAKMLAAKGTKKGTKGGTGGVKGCLCAECTKLMY